MAENSDTRDCPRMDSAEREEQAGVRSSFRMIWKDRDKDAPDLLGKVLHRDKLNAAYKRGRKNKGAA